MASILSRKQKKREKYTLSDLKALGNQLLSSRAHINNLPLLLTFVSPSSPPQNALEAILSLQSFFTIDLPSKPSLDSKTDPELIYRTWLRSKFDDFVKSLIDILTSPQCEETLREVVLDTEIELVKLGNGGKFNSAVYHKFIHNIVLSPMSDSTLLDLLESKYFKYIDVRYFTYISLKKIITTLETKDTSENRTANAEGNSGSSSKASMELSVHKVHHILARIPPLEVFDEKSDYELWSGSGFSSDQSDQKEHAELAGADDKQTAKKPNNNVSSAKIVKKMKLKFTKAWISFLRLPLPLDVYKEVLANLHQTVIPHLSNPIMLCDFLTRSYDIGGVISVMALSSLHVLMTQHGLEYPNFYEKLYALLVPSIFMAKHRAKFLQLLDSCMKSPLLPAYLAAAFTKKLSRLALSVPPSGSLVIIALIHNLLRRHPSINCLVHRENNDGTARDDSRASQPSDEAEDSGNYTDLSSRKQGIDHFNNEENDPVKSNAMRSSLWEVDTLRNHYCPPVSRFVLSLENDLTVRAKTTEITVKDFSSASYATIFREEMGRRVKQVPLAFYKATPTSLFSESDFVGWTFKCKQEEEETGNEHDHNISAKRQRLESS